jgi:hypothetical protein
MRVIAWPAMSATDSEPAPAGPEELPPLVPTPKEGYFGGARLLAADIRIASLFADEARRRTMQRVFGIPRGDKSGLATLIALVALGETLRRRTEGISAPSTPTVPGVVVGVSLVRELAYDIAGPWSRESPYFGTLLALALIGGTARMAVRGSAHQVRALSHKGIAEFEHRYGHLIRPNRPRPPK